MTTLVSKADLARRRGVTKAAITKAAVKQFPAALVGDRVDLDHPDVQRYLSAATRGSTSGTETPPSPASEPTALRPAPTCSGSPPVASAQPSAAARATTRPPTTSAELDNAHRDTKPEDIEVYAHLTLEQLVKKFGTATAFQDWLAARKRIADIREKDLKNDERAGRLIPRELVRTHVFSHIEAANRRLLQDAATTIARRLYAAAQGGTSVEDAERLVREIMSSHLKPVQASAARVLRGESTV